LMIRLFIRTGRRGTEKAAHLEVKAAIEEGVCGSEGWSARGVVHGKINEENPRGTRRGCAAALVTWTHSSYSEAFCVHT